MSENTDKLVKALERIRSLVTVPVGSSDRTSIYVRVTEVLPLARQLIEENERLTFERDDYRSAWSDVALQLGLPATYGGNDILPAVSDLQARLSEAEEDLETERQALQELTAQRDHARTARDFYRTHRNQYKATIERLRAEIDNWKSSSRAYADKAARLQEELEGSGPFDVEALADEVERLQGDNDHLLARQLIEERDRFLGELDPLAADNVRLREENERFKKDARIGWASLNARRAEGEDLQARLSTAEDDLSECREALRGQMAAGWTQEIYEVEQRLERAEVVVEAVKNHRKQTGCTLNGEAERAVRQYEEGK